MRSGLFRFSAVLVAAYLLCSCVFGQSAHSRAADLSAAVRQMMQPTLDTISIPVANVDIVHHDCIYHLKEGRVHPFVPVTVDGEPRRWGAFFVGRATLVFTPRVPCEQNQLRRFFGTDSLTTDFETAVFLVTDSIYSVLTQGGIEPAVYISKEDRSMFEAGCEFLTRYDNHYYMYTVLKNLMQESREPFLLVNAVKQKANQIIYKFDPLSREEVSLSYKHPEVDGLELVCSYSGLAGATYEHINGECKDEIAPVHYSVSTIIDVSGMVRCRADLIANVVAPSAGLLEFDLHPLIVVDSIQWLGKGQVEFLRHDSTSTRKGWGVYTLLPASLAAGDKLKLTFWYHGEIAERDLGLFFVDASTDWYPKYGFRTRATMSLNFKTPAEFKLVVNADLLDTVTIGDTLMTTWQMPQPATGVTFNIADFEIRRFEEDGLPGIDFYHNQVLHRDILKDYNENWYKNISTDVVGSLRLFESMYGSYPSDHFVVTEILYNMGESFPGLINLSLSTFRKKKQWGDEMIFRAHEVAHQWWGSGVSYETYHDQWLSEGLAEYSAMRYLNTVIKNEDVLEGLRQFRDAVFANHRESFLKGEESGPIILGYRTSSTKARDGHALIIYGKAALVLHMLRCQLTDWRTLDTGRFDKILREYYRRFAGRTASTQDFKAILEEQLGLDMTWFFNQWIYGNDLPEYTFTREIVRDDAVGGWRASCKVEQREVPQEFTVIMPIEIDYGDGDKQYTAKVIRGDVTEFDLAFAEKPKSVRLNPFEAVLCKVVQ